MKCKFYICISKNHGDEAEIGFPGEEAGFDPGLKVNCQRKRFHAEGEA